MRYYRLTRHEKLRMFGELQTACEVGEENCR